MRDILKILAYAIFAGIVGVIVFVRPSELGGTSGGKQASDIINASATGFAGVIKAAQGR